MRLSKKYFYMACVCMLMLGFTSCETDDSDVAELITGSTEGSGTEAPFAMEGTWVAGGMNLNVTVLNNTDFGKTLENLLLGVLNEKLPVKIESLADLELALKIEKGAEGDMAKISSPTIDIIANNPGLFFELPKTDLFAINSENKLADMLGKITFLDYVTDENPNGIPVSESPLAALAGTLGENATLQSVGFTFEKSLFNIQVSEENQDGQMTLSVDGKLNVLTKNSGLAGIFLRNVESHIEIQFSLDEWTALK